MRKRLFHLVSALLLLVSCTTTVVSSNSSPLMTSSVSNTITTSANNSLVETTINTSSTSFSSIAPLGSVTVDKTTLIGLPGHEYEIGVTNTTNEQLQIIVGDNNYSLLNCSIISIDRIKISLLTEGTGYVVVKTNSTEGVRINVESTSLEITNNDDHVDVGDTLQITLSKDVNATYNISDSSIATISENGLVTVYEKGQFEVIVTYGEIVLTKIFDSYVRQANITELNRNSVFIRYHGRNVHTDGSVIMNNVGSGFEVTFYGTKLVASLDAWFGSWYGVTQVSVLVDGEKDTTTRVVKLSNATTRSDYTLVEGLSQGVHTVKVLKRTEALSTSMTLYNLKTDGYFKPVNKDERLKIEAYGDSITAGYGNLRPQANPDGTNSETQSGLQTYATYTAWELNADINVQARSGIGMYTSANVENHVNTLYNKVNYDGEYNWNMNNFVPDIVIINLGTNDFWDGNNFDLNTFKNEYVKTATNIAKAYGEDATFILASGLMETNVNPHLAEIKTLINQNVNNDIHIINFPQCEYGHPLASEHKTASDTLVKYIRDNNLDVIHSTAKEDTIIADSQNKDVSATFTIELQDELPNYCDLYIKGLGDEIKLDKVNEFTYSTTKTIKEGDYNLSFNINNDDEYSEYESKHLVQIRESNKDIKLKLDSFLALPEDPNENAATFGWEMSTHAYEANFTTTSKENVVINNSTNWMAGFVYNKANLGDNYKLSLNVKSEATISDQTFIGVCPYYQDDLNYIVIYLQWQLVNGAYSIKSVGSYRVINGVQLGFDDYWTFANINVDLINGIDVEIYRSGTQIKVKIGNVSETKTFYRINKDTKYYGVWSYADKPVTYTNINQTADSSLVTPTWSQTWCLGTQTYSAISDNEVSLNNASNWMAGFIVKNSPYGDNYAIEAIIKAEKDNYQPTDDAQIGLVPYFADQNNFIVVYLQWGSNPQTTPGKLPSIGMTGKIDGADLGWNDFWSFQNMDTTLTQGNTLKVARNGNKITVTYGGKTESRTISSLAGLTNYACGVWCHNTGTSNFSNISITEKI